MEDLEKLNLAKMLANKFNCFIIEKYCSFKNKKEFILYRKTATISINIGKSKNETGIFNLVRKVCK